MAPAASAGAARDAFMTQSPQVKEDGKEGEEEEGEKKMVPVGGGVRAVGETAEGLRAVGGRRRLLSRRREISIRRCLPDWKLKLLGVLLEDSAPRGVKTPD